MIDISAVLEGADWDQKEPVDPLSISELTKAIPEPLPDAYLALLQYSNGGEGPLSIEPAWLQLWPAEDVLRLNRAYHLDTSLPGYLGIGSSGGGELLALSLQHSGSLKVVMIPFIPLTEAELVIVADDFESFIRAIGREME